LPDKAYTIGNLAIVGTGTLSRGNIGEHYSIRSRNLIENNDRYALMQTVWNRGQRVRGNLIYITIENCQINVEYDGIEQGITQDLTEQGIPISQITHTFLSKSTTLVEA
jgi:hypothetical protein